MSTHELPPEKWDAFCKRLAESHRNSLIAVNTLEDGQPKQVFVDLPLQNIAMHHPENSCNDVLVIEAGCAGRKAHQFLHCGADPFDSKKSHP